MSTIENLLRDEVAFWRNTVALVGDKTSKSSRRRMKQALQSAEQRLAEQGDRVQHGKSTH